MIINDNNTWGFQFIKEFFGKLIYRIVDVEWVQRVTDASHTVAQRIVEQTVYGHLTHFYM